jgi:hypothetical protein
MEYRERLGEFIGEIVNDEIDDNECSIDDIVRNLGYNGMGLTAKTRQYITEEMKIVDEDTLHMDKFNNNNNNYMDFRRMYGEPSGSLFLSFLKELDDEFGLENVAILNKSFEDAMETYICCIAFRIISEIAEERIELFFEEISKRRNAISTIQRAFRKYRYTPEYKYCKFIQTENGYKSGFFTKEEFEKYLTDEKITVCDLYKKCKEETGEEMYKRLSMIWKERNQ